MTGSRIAGGSSRLGLKESSVYGSVEAIPFTAIWPSLIAWKIFAFWTGLNESFVIHMTESYATEAINIFPRELDSL